MKWLIITLLIVAVVRFCEFWFSVFSYPTDNTETKNTDDENNKKNGFMFPI